LPPSRFERSTLAQHRHSYPVRTRPLPSFPVPRRRPLRHSSRMQRLSPPPNNTLRGLNKRRTRHRLPAQPHRQCRRLRISSIFHARRPRWDRHSNAVESSNPVWGEPSKKYISWAHISHCRSGDLPPRPRQGLSLRPSRAHHKFSGQMALHKTVKARHLRNVVAPGTYHLSHGRRTGIGELSEKLLGLTHTHKIPPPFSSL
jgi:hypothetical protein